MAVNYKLQDFRINALDIARPNRFLVSFAGGNNTEFSLTDSEKYYVRSASLPGKTVGDISNLFWFGQNYKIAGDPTFEDITLKFLNNHGFSIRQKAELWLDNIAKTVENTRGNPEDYKMTMQLDQVNLANEIVASYHCYGVYPKNITAIELSHESNDALEEFDVTFSIDYWSNATDGGGTGTVETK